MSAPVLLRVEGEVAQPQDFTWQDLADLDDRFQIADVRQFDPQRQGGAVTLEGILQHVGAGPAGAYLTLHATADDFHASIPIEAVRDRGFFVYRLGNQPLSAEVGGPVRFLIRDFAACHSAQVDECANVKFVDRIELSAERGFDNRPQDDEAHQALHHPEEDA